MRIKGNTILITGGTGGIGQALAESLQPENHVIVAGRSPEKLAHARKKGFTCIECDLTSRESMERLVVEVEQKHQGLNVLINNAGVQYNYDFCQEPNVYQRIDTETMVNLTGTIQLTHLLLPLLQVNRGSILNVTSALGTVPKTDGLVYSASKAGLRNFHRGLKKSLRAKGVRCHEIIPPVTETGMTQGRDEKKMSPDSLAKLILRQWGKGRRVIAPFKVKLLLLINRISPGLADRIIR